MAAATDANQPTFLVSLHDKHGRLYNVEQNFKEFYELMTLFYFSIQSEAFMLLYSTDNPVKLVDNAIKSNPFILAAFQKCMPNLEQVRYFEIDFEESKLALAANVLLDFLLLKFSNVNNLHRFTSIIFFFIIMIISFVYIVHSIATRASFLTGFLLSFFPSSPHPYILIHDVRRLFQSDTRSSSRPSRSSRTSRPFARSFDPFKAARRSTTRKTWSPWSS